MEQVLLTISEIIGCSTIMVGIFSLGFVAGQKSVKLVGQRTELLQSSDRLTIQRSVPDIPTYNDPYVAVPSVPSRGVSMVAPPEYKKLHEEWIREQGGSN